MKQTLLKSWLVLICLLAGVGSVWADGWTRCTAVSDLTSGGTFILGYEASARSGKLIPMKNTDGTATTSAAGYMASGSEINMATVTTTTDYEFTIVASTTVEGAICIKVGDNYIGNTDTKNNCKLFPEEATTTSFVVTVTTNDVFTLKIAANKTYTTLQYNTSSPRFAVYGGTQKNLVIYKKESGSSASAAAAPTLTAAGTFSTATYDVTITNKEDGATVYYTTDGTTPTTSSASFTGASKTITIEGTTTVKAMAVADGKDNSSVASATYTYEKPIANTAETAYTTAEAIDLIVANSPQLATTEVYVKGAISKIDGYNTTWGSITYWLDDNTFEIYSGLGMDGAKFAAQTDLQLGDEVVVKGIIKKYNSTYEMDKNNVLISRKSSSLEIATLTLGTYKTALTTGDDDEFTVETNSDSEVSVTSSNEAVAEAIIVDGTILISAVGAGTTTITISTEKTSTYLAAEKSYTLTVSGVATLPFAFTGKKAAIANTEGMSQEGLGNDYSSAPYLKFDNTDDNLIINFKGVSDKPMYLVYDIKGNSFNGSTFTVQESADGEAYTTVKTYADLEATTKTEVATLASTSKFVKFVYTNKLGGNVALGNIKIGVGYARSVAKGSYGTICLPCAVEAPQGATFSTITGVEADGTTLTLAPATSLEAGVPYIFEATASTIICDYTGDAVEAPVNGDYLIGTFTTTTAPVGAYVLQCQNSVYGFYEVAAAGINVPANRAYVKTDANVKAFFFNAEDTATGIDAMTDNGQLTTDKSIYNLAGQRVNKAQKGIYIVNGKKVLF